MSVNLKELKEKRQNLYNQQQELYNTAKEEKRELTQDEQVKYDKMDQDFWNIDKQVKQAESLNADVIETVEKNQPAKPATSEEHRNAFMDYLRNGNEMKSESRKVLRAQSTTDAAGGHTIPAEFSGEIEKSLKAYGGMIENCRIVTTDTGASLDWPTMDDTTNTGKLVSEGASLTASSNDLVFANKQLGAYKFSSDLLLVNYELLQDSAFNFEAEIMRPALEERVGRVINTYFTTGTGSSQPTGIMAASGGSAKGADAAAVAAISRDDIVNLIHSVDPAYRRNAKLSFNDATLKEIKKLSFGSADDRPLYQVSPIVGEADMIEGYEFFINQDIANIGASAKSMAFGDWSKYVIRRVGGVRVVRLNERFADTDQVAFAVLARFDGLPTNTAAVKHLLHPAV